MLYRHPTSKQLNDYTQSKIIQCENNVSVCQKENIDFVRESFVFSLPFTFFFNINIHTEAFTHHDGKLQMN